MNETIEAIDIPDFLRELFPEAGDDLLRLFASAAENANLVHADFYTIRDLLDLAEYHGPPTLHVLLLDLLLALEEGSLCVEASLEGLSRRLADLVGEPEARAWGERILADLERADFCEVVGTGRDYPLILHDRAGKPFAYFQKYFHHERVFEEALRARLDTAPAVQDIDGLRSAVQEVLVHKPLLVEGRPLVLDDRQKLALALGLLRNLAIVSGGPGTGKTSIVLTLLRCLVRAGYRPERIALAAPTGRAAQRLSDALRTGLDSLGELEADDAGLLDLGAQTLHHLLRYNPSRGSFGRHCENPIPADVVVIDEVSMVGLVLMSQLLQALGPETRLILLGDKDQLPSVEAGAVLASLMPEDGAPAYSEALRGEVRQVLGPVHLPEDGARVPAAQDALVVLEENYRSQPDIREAARAVNRQDVAVVERLPAMSQLNFADLEERGGCWLLPQTAGNVAELRRTLEQWADHQYLTPGPAGQSYQDLVARCAGLKLGEDLLPADSEALDALFAALARSRLLTLVREGPWGCVDINRFLDRHLRPLWDRGARTGLFAGVPVLITRNDQVRQLYNGDVGVALRSPGGGLHVVFPRQGGYVAFAADALPAHELGFALTVHKSQGSEYGQVLLMLPPAGGTRLLTKEMVYTGITRAKKLAVVCAVPDVLRYALARKIQRESGLMIRDVLDHAGQAP